MTNRYEPELGQIAFGNPWGELEAPDFVIAGLDFLGQIIAKNDDNENPAHNVAAEFINHTFEMRSYYWGDCTCGWDKLEFQEEHRSECYQTELEKMETEKRVHEGQYISNLSYQQFMALQDEIYSVLTQKYNLPMEGCAVHCTCDYNDRFEQWFEANKIGPQGHADDCKVQQPNFKYRDFEVRWYKHLHRGTACNREISSSEFSEILQRCLKSLVENTNGLDS